MDTHINHEYAHATQQTTNGHYSTELEYGMNKMFHYPKWLNECSSPFYKLPFRGFPDGIDVQKSNGNIALLLLISDLSLGIIYTLIVRLLYYSIVKVFEKNKICCSRWFLCRVLIRKVKDLLPLSTVRHSAAVRLEPTARYARVRVYF